MIQAGALDHPPLSRSDGLMAAGTLRREFPHPATVGDSVVNDNRVVVLCCLPRMIQLRGPKSRARLAGWPALAVPAGDRALRSPGRHPAAGHDDALEVWPIWPK
jgi:hypothetical protein